MGWLSFLKQSSASVPTPSIGKVAIFADSTSGEPSYMGDDGIPHSLVGTGGGGVTSLNTRTGAIALVPGTNLAIIESPTGTFTFNASGGGGSVTLPYKNFVDDYGADPTFTSDCGAAWDAYVADVEANGSIALLAQGHFKFSRALQNTGAENAQMPLPNLNYVGDAPATVYIFGGLAPPCPTVSVIGSEPDYAPGTTIFESTLASGSGSMMAAGTPGSFSNICVGLKNVIFRTVANPTISAVNLENAACAFIDSGVVIDTGEISVSSVTYPTTATSYGLKLPGNNNGANTFLGTVDVVGFYNGYSFGEHSIGLNVKAWACVNAAAFLPATHASTFLRFMPVHCNNGIVAPATGAHVLNIQQYNTEHAVSGSFTAVYDVNDSANTLHGDLHYRTVDAGIGGSDNFFVNGARNFDYRPLVKPRVRSVTSTSDTALITDADTVIKCTNAGSTTVTIPPDSSVPWKVGTKLTWVRGSSAGTLTVAGGAGVTVVVPDNADARKQGSTIQAVCTDVDEWYLVGDYS